jgi:hypothetical protein
LKRKGINYPEELKEHYELEIEENDLLEYDKVKDVIYETYHYSQILAFYLF